MLLVVPPLGVVRERSLSTRMRSAAIDTASLITHAGCPVGWTGMGEMGRGGG